MRTITEEKTLFTFSELSDEAKEKATYYFMCNDYYHNGDEWLASFQALCDAVGVNLVNYSIDYTEPYRNEVRFGYPYEVPTKKELQKVVNDFKECKATGVCFDADLADMLEEALKDYQKKNGEEALRTLMLSIFSDFGHAIERDYEAYFSEEEVNEMCEANDYEFLADGTLY